MPTGKVKFFNAAKGFGFIAPDTGGNDVFVHVSAVERAGLDGLNEGDEVEFEVEQDRRSGKPSASDLQMIAAAPAGQHQDRGPGGPPRGGGGGYGRQDSGGGGYGRQDSGGRAPARRPPGEPSGSGNGVVKWFNPTKGFGFIQPSDGGSDVFVHISAVERAGLRTLNDGQAVAYDIEQDRRTGKAAAINLRLE
ncbi:MAG TPA: cold-shock protein [Caulobacteraceae bacterium]|jgi:CspA family cold shock protein|nr:cold-shock protein [Caulobacteraceae bacterium]